MNLSYKEKFLVRENYERDRRTQLFHGFEPTRLGHGQALHQLSGSRKQISFHERHCYLPEVQQITKSQVTE